MRMILRIDDSDRVASDNFKIKSFNCAGYGLVSQAPQQSLSKSFAETVPASNELRDIQRSKFETMFGSCERKSKRQKYCNRAEYCRVLYVL